MTLIYVGSYGSGVRCFRQDQVTGDLSEQHAPLDLTDPSFLAWHRNRTHVYAACESTGEIAALAVAEDGQLTLLNIESTGGGSPCHLAVDPTGEFAVVANYGDGTVSVHPISAGAVGARSDLVQHKGTKPHAHMVSFTKYPQVLLVTDLGVDQVMSYRLEPTGTLTQLGSAPFTAGSGPRHMAHHSDGLLYVAGELDSTVDICEVRASGALVRSVARHSSLVTASDVQNYPSHIECGEHVYVANRGADCVSVFATDPWRPIADVPTGGQWPRHFALVNGFMYVANQNSGTLTVSKLDGGVPGQFRTVAEVAGASCILPSAARI